MDEETRQRVIKSLAWLVTDARHRSDECKNNLEPGSSGGYSPELMEAIELLAELEKGVRHHDRETLIAAYNKGFADAKEQIMGKIRAIVK